MDTHHLERLQREHIQALLDTEEKLTQWEKFRSDYLALKERLRTLPDKITHDVMVPFGSLAFMPGQLVHTNEVLVLLGDNYFVERSARQAADIVSRRLKELDKNIESLKEQRELLAPRADFTNEMLNLSSGAGEMREIVEPYDEETERVWREKHRENLRKARQNKKREEELANEAKPADEEQAVSDEALWRRLEELELQEKRGRELERLEDSVAEGTKSDNSSMEKKEHHWPSLEEEEEEEGDDDEDDENGDEENRPSPVKNIITFSHSKVEPETVTNSANSTSADAPLIVNSPADIYRLVQSLPKSILKSSDTEENRVAAVAEDGEDKPQKMVTFASHNESRGASHRGDGDGGINAGDARSCSRQIDSSGDHTNVTGREGAVHRAKAFTGQVMEKPLHKATVTAPASVDATSRSGQPNTTSTSRPMSRFRAARQKQGNTS